MRLLTALILLLFSSVCPVIGHAGFFDNFFGGSQSALIRPGNLMLHQVDPTLNIQPVPSPSPMLDPARSTDYKLGPGDHIAISVFNESSLSIDVRLSDSGSFSYPFVGEVIARGMTLTELQSKLTKELADGFLVEPRVYVSILEYRPFFVNGEVMKPGGYPYQPGLTVRKAIALAGGLTPRASLNKIFVIHEGDAAGAPILTSLSAMLLPGDIITVDQSFF